MTIPTMQTGDYTLGKEYQIGLLVHLAHDAELLRAARLIPIMSSDFDLPVCKLVFEVLSDFFTEYNKLPPFDILVQEVKLYAKNVRGGAQTILNDDEYDALAYVLERINAPGELCSDYYRNGMLPFIKYVRFVQAQGQAAESMSRGVGHQEFIEIVAKLAQLSPAGSSYQLSDACERVEIPATREAIIRVPTNISKLDSLLMGGLGRQEFGLVIACPGVGKTNTLINFCKGAAARGWYTLYLTVEQPAREIKQRFYAMTAQIKGHYVLQPMSEWPEPERIRFQALVNSDYSGRFFVADLSEKKPRIGDLQALIKQWKALMTERGVGPRARLVVVDWLDMVQPEAHHVSRGGANSDWNALKGLSEDMARMARAEDVALWSATQGTAEGDGVRFLQMKHTAFSFHKNDFVHVAIGIAPDKPDENQEYLEKSTDDNLNKFKIQECKRDLNYTFFKNRNNKKMSAKLYQGPTLALWDDANAALAMEGWVAQMDLAKIFHTHKLEVTA